MALGASSFGKGATFLVSAGVVYEIVAAACSSPQTTELNASARSETLMKWVYIGLGQSAFFVGAAAYLEPSNAGPILAGGIIAATVLYLSYAHAKNSGLANGGPPTEEYS